MTAPADMALTTSTTQEAPLGAPPLGEQLYTIHEIARALRVSSATVLRRIHDGSLEAIRVGREYRVTQTAWDTYRRSLAQAVNP